MAFNINVSLPDSDSDNDSSSFVPIDSMWKKESMWASLSEQPTMVTLDVKGVEHLYVLTKTRMFTHRTFVALVSDYRWFIRPTPLMKEALFDDAANNHLVGSKYTESCESVYHSWWSQTKREFAFNCKKWIDSYPDNTEADILAFLDPSNSQFTQKSDKLRSDGIASSWTLLNSISKKKKANYAAISEIEIEF